MLMWAESNLFGDQKYRFWLYNANIVKYREIAPNGASNFDYFYLEALHTTRGGTVMAQILTHKFHFNLKLFQKRLQCLLCELVWNISKYRGTFVVGIDGLKATSHIYT